jgi:hypothetical protein
MLMPCEFCQRTFLPDRLVVHQRSCRAGHATKPVASRRVHCPSTSPPLSGPLTDSPKPAVSSDAHGGESGPPAATESSSDADLELSSTAPLLHSTSDLSTALERESLSQELSAARISASLDCCAESESSPKVRKIPLNDVSVFRDVKSRVFQSSDSAGFPRCRFCNRTFAEQRLAKHESVCTERNVKKKVPQGNTQGNTSQIRPAARHVKASASRGTENTGAPNSSRSGTPSLEASGSFATASHNRTPVETPEWKPSAVVQKYCTECGHRLYSATQKFCGECGTRILHSTAMD